MSSTVSCSSPAASDSASICSSARMRATSTGCVIYFSPDLRSCPAWLSYASDRASCTCGVGTEDCQSPPEWIDVPGHQMRGQLCRVLRGCPAWLPYASDVHVQALFGRQNQAETVSPGAWLHRRRRDPKYGWRPAADLYELLGRQVVAATAVRLACCRLLILACRLQMCCKADRAGATPHAHARRREAEFMYGGQLRTFASCSGGR